MSSQPINPVGEALSAQVAKLERRTVALDSLCGEILACLNINLTRGTLTHENGEELRGLLEGWSQRHRSA